MFNWFKKAKYTEQQLTVAQKTAIDAVDNWCVDTYTSPVSEMQKVQVIHVVVPLYVYIMGTDAIQRFVAKNLPQQGAYIPRSIAFIQGATEWHLIVAVRTDDPTCEQCADLTNVMFIELLTRTNSARSE